VQMHQDRSIRARRLGVFQPCGHAAFGWQIHGGVEVTELSTNKQLSLSVLWILCGVTLLFVVYVFDLLLRVAFALHLPLQLIPP
jgi:hypothetical protein